MRVRRIGMNGSVMNAGIMRTGDCVDGASRTILVVLAISFADGKSGFVQAGAGIVFDSIPDNELKETEHKANAMITALKEASK